MGNPQAAAKRPTRSCDMGTPGQSGVGTPRRGCAEAGRALFGRRRELDVLDGLLDGIGERGAALLVHGPAGIGKSALLSAARAAAVSRGIQVLTVTGVQSEAHLPFAGLHQLIRSIADRVEDLPVPQRDAVRAAFGVTAEAAPNPFYIALAALDLLADAAASMPLLLIAEDVQWLDRPSLDVLAFVARRLESDQIVLLAAGRAGLDSPLAGAGLPELPLAGLGPEACRALLDASFPCLAGVERERVLEHAAGSPLALVELPIALRARQAADGGLLPEVLPLTTRLERAFATRTLELPPATRALLLLTAVNDSDDLAEVVRAGAALGRTEMTAAALMPAVHAGLIQVEDTKIRFRHPLVRSAVYAEVSLPQRQAAHAALAGLLADQPDRLAWHRAASITGPDEAVAAELEQAAARAHARGAFAAAVAAQERAAQLTGDPAIRGRRLLHAAELASDLGRREIVGRLVQQAQSLGLGTLERTRLAWLQDMIDPGRPADSGRLRALVGLAYEARRGADTDLALNILGGAALRCFWADHGEQVRCLIVTAAEEIPVPADDPRLLATLGLAAPIARGSVVIDRVAGLASHAAADAGGLHLAGLAATIVGDYDNGAALLAAAATLLRAQGRLSLLAQALVAQAWAATQLMDWDVAIPAAEEGVRLARETAQPFFAATGELTEALLAGLHGNEDVAAALTSKIEREMIPAGGRAVLAMVQLTRGLSALGAARHAEAYAHLRRMFDPADIAYHHTQRYWGIGELAEAAVHSDHRDEARAQLPELERAAKLTPSPWLHVSLRYARALLADDSRAEELFEAAIGTGMARWPFYRARAQLAYGSWLRRRRRVTDSRPPLRAARDGFDGLGLIPWGERARQELRAAGEASLPDVRGTRDRLSPQELQIAEMVADGLSNRDIGQQLYLSHRTVGSHLYRIFPKLGITSRSQMLAALRGEAALQSGHRPPVAVFSRNTLAASPV